MGKIVLKNGKELIIRKANVNGTETAMEMPLFVNILNKSTATPLIKYHGI